MLKVRVLDYKKCESSVKLKDPDSHIIGASLLQISATYLLKSDVGTTYTRTDKTAKPVLNGKQALARLRFK